MYEREAENKKNSLIQENEKPCDAEALLYSTSPESLTVVTLLRHLVKPVVRQERIATESAASMQRTRCRTANNPQSRARATTAAEHGVDPAAFSRSGLHRWPDYASKEPAAFRLECRPREAPG